MLNNIINDLRNLEGKEVGKQSYFHKIYTNNANLNEISTIDILENLESYEIEKFEIMNYLDEYEDEILEVNFDEFCDIEEYEIIKSDNSYNWSSPLTNHINFRIYKSNLYEGIIVELSVHKYGDVRCNYTDDCYFRFDNEYEFYEVMCESNKYFTVKDKNNNIEYDITINILSDCPEITIYSENKEEYYDGYEAYEILENIMENIENYEL